MNVRHIVGCGLFGVLLGAVLITVCPFVAISLFDVDTAFCQERL